MTKGAKFGIVGLILAAGGYFAYEPVKLAVGLQKKGVFDKPIDEKYDASMNANLKAIHTALMFAHDSDGQFPPAGSWLDEVEKRVKTGSMKDEEALKKIVDPSFIGQPGKYGFAMNTAAAGKSKDDLKDPKTILVFTSQATARNVVGDPMKDKANPARPGGNYGVTLDGNVLKL